MDDIYYIVKSKVYEFAQYAVEEQYKIQPAWTSYGSSGYIRALEDSRYHMLMLASSYALDNVHMLENYYSWLTILFNRLKLPANAAIDSLTTAADVIDTKLHLNDAMKKFVAKASQNYHNTGSESFLELSEQAQKYYNFITTGNQRQAVNYIVDVYKQGMPIIDIYNTIFIPTQRLIGKLWHEGSISVGEEHYCTAATQLAIANLYQFFLQEKKSHASLLRLQYQASYMNFLYGFLLIYLKCTIGLLTIMEQAHRFQHYCKQLMNTNQIYCAFL